MHNICVKRDISYIFSERSIRERIKEKLPKLFAIAELESSRAGRIGMEVGSMREQILIALLVYAFGEQNVDDDIPITKYEEDVKVFGKPVSIKTITGGGGIKAVWTVDPQRARKFYDSYKCSCDMLLAIIRWNDGGRHRDGGLYFIPREVQEKVLEAMGKAAYLNVPKLDTNPRGVEISREAIESMIRHKETLRVEIEWKKGVSRHKTYRRWLELWKE
jgi:hypothetical protein